MNDVTLPIEATWYAVYALPFPDDAEQGKKPRLVAVCRREEDAESLCGGPHHWDRPTNYDVVEIAGTAPWVVGMLMVPTIQQDWQPYDDRIIPSTEVAP